MMPKSQTSAPAGFPWATSVMEWKPLQQVPASSVVMAKAEKEEVIWEEEQLAHSCTWNSQLCGFHPLDSGVDKIEHKYNGTLVPLVVIKKEEEKKMEIPQDRPMSSASIPVVCQPPSLGNHIKCEAKQMSPPSDGCRRKRMRCNKKTTAARGKQGE